MIPCIFNLQSLETWANAHFQYLGAWPEEDRKIFRTMPCAIKPGVGCLCITI